MAPTVELMLATILCLTQPGPVLAQSSPVNPSRPLSLEEAVGLALKNHPALRQAEAAVEMADAEVRQVRANYFPQVTLSAIGKIGLSGATGALGLPGFPGSPFFRNVAYSANWYQTVFDFGRTRRRVASREALVENARLKKASEADRIVRAVNHAYFSALEAQRLQELAEVTVNERRLTLRRVRAYFQAQLRSQLDVSLAEANLAEAEGGLVRARNTVHTAFAALRAAMGLEGEPAYELQEPELVVPPMSGLEDQVQAALGSRPDMKALEAKVTALSEEVGVTRNDRRPEVRGVAAAGQGRFAGTAVRENQRHGVGGLGIILPLFTGGRLKAEEQEARAELEGALAARDLLRQQILLEVTQARDQLLALGERIQVAVEQERAAGTALRLAHARFQAQLASFLELTTAEVALTQAGANHAQSVYDYHRARADLEFATGQAAKP